MVAVLHALRYALPNDTGLGHVERVIGDVAGFVCPLARAPTTTGPLAGAPTYWRVPLGWSGARSMDRAGVDECDRFSRSCARGLASH